MRTIIAAVLIFASFQSLDCLSGATNSRLNYFDIDLLRYVAEGKSGNVMVSPLSIKSTLAMLLEGASGTTAAELKTALRLMPNTEDYRRQLNGLLKDLQVNGQNVTVQNANGLFVSNKLTLKKEYEQMAKRLYYSEVTNLDFTNPKIAADAINGWVSNNTKGLIPNIIHEAHITPNLELVVTNALYFKGTWLHQFDSRPPDCFYRDQVCRNVEMMELDAELNYAYVDNLRAHALELPYQGNRHSMFLLVPSDIEAGIALIRDLPYIGLLEISNQMRPSDVILTMPKFTVEFGADLVGALKNMKIDTLFTRDANLSGIFADPRASGQINSIFHKVYMKVDETGTVAAAATAGQVVPLINSFVNLRVDRPFLFFIWDNEKGVVLFEGKIEEPTEVVGAINNSANNGNIGHNGQQGVIYNPIPSSIKVHSIANQHQTPNQYQIPNQQQTPNQYQIPNQYQTFNQPQTPNQQQTPNQYQNPNQYQTPNQYQNSNQYQTTYQPQTPNQHQTPNQPQTPNQYQTFNQPLTPDQHQTPNQPQTPNQYQTFNQPQTHNQQQPPNQYQNPNQYQTPNHHETPNQHQFPIQHETPNQPQTLNQPQTPNQPQTANQHQTPNQHHTPIQHHSSIDAEANYNFERRPISFDPIHLSIGQRFNSQPNQPPIQTTNQPISTQPITEPPTNPPTTTTAQGVLKKIWNFIG